MPWDVILPALIRNLVIVGVGTVLFVTVFMFLIRKFLGRDLETLRNGIPGHGKILKVWQTGISLNDQPQIGMDLEVHPPSGAPYQAQTKMIVPLIKIPQVQPGAVLPVKISRTDPDKVVLDV